MTFIFHNTHLLQGKTKMKTLTRRKKQTKKQTKNQKQETHGKTTNTIINKEQKQTQHIELLSTKGGLQPTRQPFLLHV